MSLMSMTGYGTGVMEVNATAIRVEIRSVNHRFLDVSFKLPNAYTALETSLLGIVRDKVARGHLDISINRTAPLVSEYRVNLNQALFSEYWLACKQAISQAGAPAGRTKAAVLANLLTRKEIVEFEQKEGIEDEEIIAIEEALKMALDSLASMRAREGSTLALALTQNLNELIATVANIKSYAKDVVSALAIKIRARIANILTDSELDPQRIAQEVAILADKADINEELVRLDSHIAQFHRLLAEHPVGRKLDFLIQEMLREVNTCASKSQSSEIAQSVVEAKALLEKLREQVQNIE